MLARRSISYPTDLAFYRCRANRPVGLPALARVAGPRWSAEKCFQATKSEVGFDHCPVRKHIAWYRHVTSAMVAHADLAFPAADPPVSTSDDGVGDCEADDFATGDPTKPDSWWRGSGGIGGAPAAFVCAGRLISTVTRDDVASL